MKLPKKPRVRTTVDQFVETIVGSEGSDKALAEALRSAEKILLELEQEQARSEDMSDLRTEQLASVRNALARELAQRGHSHALPKPKPPTSWAPTMTEDEDMPDTYEEDAYSDYSVVTSDGVVGPTQSASEPLYDEFGEFDTLQAAQASLRDTLKHLNNYLQDAHARLGEIDQRIAYFVEHSRQVRSKVVINHVDCPCCGQPNMPMTDGTIYCNNTDCGAYRPLEQ